MNAIGMKETVLLTIRERDILMKAAEGLTVQEIAAMTAVSVEIARMHQRNILQKLRARTLAHAVAEAVRRGMIE